MPTIRCIIRDDANTLIHTHSQSVVYLWLCVLFYSLLIWCQRLTISNTQLMRDIVSECVCVCVKESEVNFVTVCVCVWLLEGKWGHYFIIIINIIQQYDNTHTYKHIRMNKLTNWLASSSPNHYSINMCVYNNIYIYIYIYIYTTELN